MEKVLDRISNLADFVGVFAFLATGQTTIVLICIATLTGSLAGYHGVKYLVVRARKETHFVESAIKESNFETNVTEFAQEVWNDAVKH